MGDMMMRLGRSTLMLVAVGVLFTVACGKKKPPIALPTPPPPATASATPSTPRPPAPPQPVAEPVIVPAEPVKDDAIASGSLDEINRNSPLKPIFFELDSSDISSQGRTVLDANAAAMR